MGYEGKVYSNTLASLSEARILDEEKQRRLIDASYSDALKILADYGWGDGDETDIEDVVSKETSKLLGFVSENCSSNRVKSVLLAPFVFNNAKALYKSKITGMADGHSLYGGLPDMSGILEDNYSELPAELTETLTALDEQREDGATLTSVAIDRAVSGSMYDYLTRITKFSPRLKKYIQSETDMLNLMTLLRCKRLGFGEELLSSNLIGGGKIKQEELTAALSGSDENFWPVFEDSGYDEVFSDASADFADIEVAIDNYLYALTLSGKERITSNAPFINYFYKQLYEYKVVKMILICIKNGETGEIKRRLRDIYE